MWHVVRLIQYIYRCWDHTTFEQKLHAVLYSFIHDDMNGLQCFQNDRFQKRSVSVQYNFGSDRFRGTQVGPSESIKTDWFAQACELGQNQVLNDLKSL